MKGGKKKIYVSQAPQRLHIIIQYEILKFNAPRKLLSKKFCAALDAGVLTSILSHELIHSVLMVARLNKRYSSITVIPLVRRKKVYDLPSISFAAIKTHSANLLLILF
jgi:hypothetical protein